MSLMLVQLGSHYSPPRLGLHTTATFATVAHSPPDRNGIGQYTEQ